MLKKLKSLFIVEEETSTSGEASQVDREKIETAPEPDTSEQLADMVDELPTMEVGTKPDTKFVNVLLKAIDAANIEGFDYLEYKQSLQSLAKMDMDEATRYQSAFAMAKTMGASPASLVDSASQYLQVLKMEDSKFSKALVAQRQKQIVAREKALKKLETTIVEKKKKIKALDKEIEQHQQELGQKKSSIDQAKAKVETTASQFKLAYNSVTAQIQKDIDRMKTYLK